MLGGLGWQELLIILAILALLFGANRVAGLGSALGRGIREFRTEVKTDPEPETPPKPAAAPPPPAAPAPPPAVPRAEEPTVTIPRGDEQPRA